MVTKHREREDKYTVPVNAVLPDLADLTGDGGRVATASYQLVNLYFDTADARLQRAGLTLRRRSGGPDAGWQLKVPAGGARTEVASRSTARTPPRGLTDILLGTTHGHPLGPVAELTTTRAVTRLYGADERLLLEVADDRVSSTTLGESARLDSWREVEVELGPGGGETLLAAVGRRLRDDGATPSPHRSKLARALGRDAQGADDLRAGRAAETLADLLGDYIRAQCTEIVAGDLALRMGEPQVHRTRVAIRRLRSTLRVFAELLDPQPAQRLEAELSWFAGLLGEVRDREVLLERLLGQVAALPPELVLGPVAADLDATLTRERAQHLRLLAAELRGDRELDLLEALARWQTEPPFLEGAGTPAKQVKTYVTAARSTMRRRLRRALVAGEDQEERLHRARKAAKRARYAGELATPGWSGAASVVLEAKQLQTELGEHQDSAVAAAFLRRAGAAAGGRPGRNGFTYGLLLAQEWQRAAALREALGVR